MSQRERWVVYPLLFLTLGIALRDKVVPPSVRALSVEAGLVRCGEIEIIDAQGKSFVRVGVVGKSGRLELETNDGRETLILGVDSRQRPGLYAKLPNHERPVPLSLTFIPELAPDMPNIHPQKDGGRSKPSKGDQPQAKLVEPEEPKN